MTNNTKRRQRARAVIFYFSMVLSLGLIWGGGMSLLRGGIVEGVIAILLGILLQLGLKRSALGSRESRPKSDRRGAGADEEFYGAGETNNTTAIEHSDDAPKQEQQKVLQRQGARGTDGATLLLDANSKLDLPRKFEEGATDES